MDIDFLAMQIRDFKSFIGKPHTLKLNRPGLCFLKGENVAHPSMGSNGAGKSTLWDALVWCIYGRTSKGLRNPDIKPWKGPKKSQVIVKLRVRGKIYNIKRQTNPNRLTINKKDAGQEAVDRLVGMSFDLFKNTILLAQGMPLFFDLSPRGKMDLFADVLALDRWDARAKKASELVSDIELTITENERELAGARAALRETKDGLEELRKSEAIWSEEQGKSIEGKHGEIEALKKQLDPLVGKVEAAEVEVDVFSTERESIDAQVKKHSEQYSEKSRKVHQIKLERRAASDRIAKLDDQIEKLKSTSKCPLCGQSVKARDLSKHRKELIEERDELKTKLKTLKVRALEKGMADDERAINNLNTNREMWSKKIRTAERVLELNRPRLIELKEKIAYLTRSEKEHREAENPYTFQMQKFRRRKILLSRNVQEYKKVLRVARRKLERASFWVKGFKELKLYIIDEVLQQLELATNSMLVEVGLEEWSVKYGIEEETKSGTIRRSLNVQIFSPMSESGAKWESWSGGEGQRLRIVGSLSLSDVLLARLGLSCNLEVLDEPTQHLAPEGIRDLCGFLADRARKNGSAIWYVDHQAVESHNFSSSVLIRQTSHGARITGQKEA